jgi:hypothetical protein
MNSVPTDIDPELAAMTTILHALEPLDEATRIRILIWIANRLEVNIDHSSKHNSPKIFDPGNEAREESLEDKTEEKSANQRHFSDLAELFDAASPNTDADKALVAAYWEQVCNKSESFESQPINSGLKNLGHGIKNITNALTTLKSKRPSLVIQLQKSGKAQQARKRYKLTEAGIKAVEAMISG